MKMKTLGAFCVVLAAASVLGLGCSDDDGGGDSSEASARTASESASSLNGLKSDPADENALANLHALNGEGQVLAARGLSFDIPTSELAPFDGVAKAMRTFGQFASCVSGNNPYTYTGCELNGATFDGNLSINGDSYTFTFDVNVDPNQFNDLVNSELQGSGVSIRYDLTDASVNESAQQITISDTLIDGSIQFATFIVGTVTTDLPGIGEMTNPYNETVTLELDFDNLQFDVDSCATGGSLTVTQSGGLGTYDPVTATYGPGCGDIAIAVNAQ